jgi:rubrerythrin
LNISGENAAQRPETRAGEVMGKRKISARQIVTDLRAGMNDSDLMEKYLVNLDALRYLFKKLVESGMMTELQYFERIELSESTVFKALSDNPDDVLNCPNCGRPLPEYGQECEFCGNVTLG